MPTRRLFPKTLQELIHAHMDKRAGAAVGWRGPRGNSSRRCALPGLDEDAALDVEEYLVNKYSLASKHPRGLNMIPGEHNTLNARLRRHEKGCLAW
jgi:hypothetical protein